MIEYNVNKMICSYHRHDAKVGDCAIDFIYLGAIISDIQITFITAIDPPTHVTEETIYTIREQDSAEVKKTWLTLSEMVYNKKPMNDIVNFMEFMAL